MPIEDETVEDESRKQPQSIENITPATEVN